ncbi:hypothetical protein H2248_012587 [Termitomyces sp. 'cryptogamus']|nr:hypothetical protein H2248_012587 [Termitomyces sp. 'cryptogamus']
MPHDERRDPLAARVLLRYSVFRTTSFRDLSYRHRSATRLPGEVFLLWRP